MGLCLFTAVRVGIWDLALLLRASVAAPMSGKNQAGTKAWSVHVAKEP